MPADSSLALSALSTDLPGLEAPLFQRAHDLVRLQQSMDAYHASAMANSNRTDAAINNWDYRAIRGCQPYVDAYGQQRWYCP